MTERRHPVLASVLRDGIDTWFIRRIVVCHTVNQFRDWKVQYRIIKFDDASILLKPVVAVASVSYRSSGIMLNWALTFLIVAIIAGLLGFGGIAGEAAWVAHVLFVVFLVLFLVSLIAGRRSPPI